jgi:hypothetical protein
MPKFKFTQEDLDKMILDAMKQPATGAKPNVLQGLLAKVGNTPTATSEVPIKGK